MKKKLLICLLLTVICFWHFNVKAEGIADAITEDAVASEVISNEEIVGTESENEEESDDESEEETDEESDEEIGTDEEELVEEKEEDTTDETEKEEETTEEETTTTDDVEEENNEEGNTEILEEVEEENENYEVTFSHGEYRLSIKGGSSILLSKLTKKLGINISMSDVDEITISNEEVLKIVNVENSNDYNIQSLKSFDTEEELIIKLKDGREIIIKVVDPVGETPKHDKELTDNGDGTYTISLTVKGDAEKQVNKVNVIVVLDTSGSMDDPTGTTEETYTATDSTESGLYGLVNGEYLPLRRGWLNGERSFYYNGNQQTGTLYTGTRYRRTVSYPDRIDAAKAAVNKLAESLLSNNGVDGNPNDTVEMALVTFATNSNVRITKTTSYDNFSNTVNNLDATGGTNWEAALRSANGINFGDNDQIYIIFVSDGNPTFRTTQNGHNDRYQNGIYGTGYEEEPNITRAYETAVTAAEEIVNGGKKFYTIGAYGNVDRMEGLTTESGAPARNYYSAENTTALQDALGSILTEIEMAGIGAVSINDGTTNSVTTSSGVSHLLDVDTNSFKYYKDDEEWADAPEATLNSNGEVVWDLSEEGVLENGVTYKVTFVVWPSQTTLDLIADLKNYPNKYDTLDANIKKYLVKDGDGYTLLTNTTASLSFKDTREENPQTHTETYTNPDPVSTSATQMLTISKKWSNGIDEREKGEITIDVLRDGESWRNDLVLNDGNNYEVSTNIAVGIMTVKNGEVEIKANGHDFSFGELGDEAYNWELKSQVVHPMLINGELTILIRQGTEKPTEGTYYKIGNYYYTVGTLTTQGVAELIATNERRSWIDLTKEVNYDDKAAHFDDELFEFEITVDNKEEKVWFSVKVSNDANAAFATTADGLVVTGATAEDGNTGYYYAAGNSPFIVKMKAGWNLRIINLLTGSTYTITEKNIDSKFAFEDITYLPTTDSEGAAYTPTINKTNYSVSGEIQKTNTKYGYTFINKNVNTEIKVIKVWDDNNDVNKNRPSNIVLNLSDGTKVVAQPTKVENEDGTWTYTYTGLAVYDGNGELIKYELTEDAVTGYTTEITGNAKEGFTVTNTLETTSVTVKKEWQDNNNQDGIRPGSVTLTLSDGTSIILNTDNNWTDTINDLPKYKNGSLVTYTVTEENVPTGYQVTYSEDGLTAINTHTPAKDDVVVTKVWEDSSNKEGLRPGEITIHLLANGTEVEATPTIAKNGDTWTFTYSGLAVNASGSKITYTVTEDKVTNYETEIDGLTITNSRDVETTEITIKKIWSDNNDQDGLRPESIEVTLSNGDKVTITKADGWTKKVTGLQKYANGEEIVYTAEEKNVPEGYKVSYSDDTLTITNTHTPATADVVVTKNWSDESNKEGLRPESITIHLLANGTEVTDVTPRIDKDGNTWTFTFEGLAVNANGSKITYTVTEDKVDNYETTINGLTITNSRTVETIELTVKKVWDDNDNQDGVRPENLTVTLSNNETVTLNAGNEWTATVTVQKYVKGQEVTYTWTEEEVTGYKLTDTKVQDNTTTFTNTHTPATADVVVTKNWSDESNKEGLRPESITIHLLANGTEVTDVTPAIDKDGNTWTFTFEGLAVNANGSKITYTVTEDKVTNYETEIDGLTITNSRKVEKVEVNVKKVWEDENNAEGFRPDEVIVNLLANGKVIDTVTLSEDNEWEYSWTELDKYAAGSKIEYTVTEDKVDNYETDIEYNEDDDVYIITNTHEVVRTSVTVKKIWVDDNNRDGVRPKKLVITIMKTIDGLSEKVKDIELNDGNEWTETIKDLLKYEKGKEVTYTAEEQDVPKGYKVSYSEDTFTITNTHKIETNSIVVTKVWEDEDNESGKRPESVTIILLANDKECDRIELSEANNWTHTFDVPVNDEYHKEITYSVSEEVVPKDYEVAYEETKDGFIIHNVLGKGDGNPPENPQTGSNIVLYLIALLISIIGLIGGKHYLKENN